MHFLFDQETPERIRRGFPDQLARTASEDWSALLSGGTPVRSNRNLLLTPVREQGNGNSLLSANENRIGSVHRY